MDNQLRAYQQNLANYQKQQQQPSLVDSFFNGLKQQAGNFINGFTNMPQQNNGTFGASIGDFAANDSGLGLMAGAATHGISALSHYASQAHMLPMAMAGIAQQAPKIFNAPKVFQGFDDLTSPFLDKIQGSSLASPEFFQNAMNQSGVKQAEKDIAGNVLQQYPGATKIPVQDFAEQFKNQLLPLTRDSLQDAPYGDYSSSAQKYENVNLPYDQRGPTNNYSENIYQSPIPTSAGGVHFGSIPNYTDNYFAHTRTEDVAPNIDGWSSNPNLAIDGNTGHLIDKTTGQIVTQADTRRLLEVQSDLFQKGNLNKETGKGLSGLNNDEILNLLPPAEGKEYSDLMSYNRSLGNGEHLTDEQRMRLSDLNSQASNLYASQRQQELSPLQAYQDIWHERVLRQEMQKAAQDGIKTLQVPTGETAMKIEGLGQGEDSWTDYHKQSSPLSADELEPGKAITPTTDLGAIDENDPHIITSVQGDGKFRSLNDLTAQNEYEIYEKVLKKYADKNGDIPDIGSIKFTPSDLKLMDKYAENRDISNKVDTSDPIYQFYENKIGKFVKSKYGAQPVTDDNGVTWNSLRVDPSLAKKAISAFSLLGGATGLGALQQYQNQQNQNKN